MTKFWVNRPLWTSVKLLLTIAVGITIANAPAQAFSFTQSGYSVRFVNPGGSSAPPGSVQSQSDGSASLSGSFDGSDLDGDGILNCPGLGGTGCEITFFAAQITGGVTVTQSPVPVIGYRGNTQRLNFSFSSPLGILANNRLNLAYTLGDPNSLVFLAPLGGGTLNVSAGNDAGSFSLAGGQYIGTTSSALTVTGDATAIPEPTGIAGLLVAVSVGGWLKRKKAQHLQAQQPKSAVVNP